jgi:hypothetical protein
MFSFLKDTNATQFYDGSAWTNLDTTGMVNPMTTTGDVIYSSSGTTPARLGIGTTGQVLTVAGGVPSWATAASGGGMTLISETVASANSSLSLSGIAGTYKQLLLAWSGIRHSGTGSAFAIRFNNDSGTNYYVSGFQASGTTLTVAGTDQTHLGGLASDVIYAFGESTNFGAITTDASGYLIIDNYASASKTKTVNWVVNFYDNSAGKYRSVNTNSFYNSTSAITSIDIVRISGAQTFTNQNNSTIRLYGVS